MSWEPMDPLPLSGAHRKTVAVTVGLWVSKRCRPRLVVTLRPGLLAEASFLKRGETVALLAGAGEHVGMLRILPGGAFRLSSVGPSPQVVGLRLPVPGNVQAAAHRAEPVEHDFDTDWLELTLPAWARPPGPHVSICSRESDPAAAARLAMRRARS